jgi:hypothetical protein
MPWSPSNMRHEDSVAGCNQRPLISKYYQMVAGQSLQDGYLYCRSVYPRRVADRQYPAGLNCQRVPDRICVFVYCGFPVVGSSVQGASSQHHSRGGDGALHLSQSSFWAVSADIAGEISGLISGVMNMCCQICGALTAFLTPYIARQYGWKSAFFCGEAVACRSAASRSTMSRAIEGPSAHNGCRFSSIGSAMSAADFSIHLDSAEHCAQP